MSEWFGKLLHRLDGLLSEKKIIEKEPFPEDVPEVEDDDTED